MYNEVEFSSLKGLTITEVRNTPNDELRFKCSDNCWYKFSHFDCCAYINIIDIDNDFSSLIGHQILLAEELTGNLPPRNSEDESYTWTFYKIFTMHSSVTITVYGSSNGWYSETMQLYKFEGDY